ncbi:hypothetical protein BC936DRAFT_138143 [Jimgerdemannia flammicorona]|uniref:Uncharacterized protein n=1 Tax=Jimgerdemannia flammicorona TaxID=994334 RepID=A0A433DIR9_9FUNG|nr:hypothetical protein BC936DRAFT_138143 [Jimgerdemannia flammicorona]
MYHRMHYGPPVRRGAPQEGQNLGPADSKQLGTQVDQAVRTTCKLALQGERGGEGRGQRGDQPWIRGVSGGRCDDGKRGLRKPGKRSCVLRE